MPLKTFSNRKVVTELPLGNAKKKKKEAFEALCLPVVTPSQISLTLQTLAEENSTNLPGILLYSSSRYVTLAEVERSRFLQALLEAASGADISSLTIPVEEISDVCRRNRAVQEIVQSFEASGVEFCTCGILLVER
ncbi:hypothetical protein C5167_036132 [Papaver somniferum]|nr:hypothetical protein C5167_036132 [Papaver somniferum]